MSVSHQPATGDGDSGDRPDFPLSDTPLLDLLDALVNGLGKVAAAEALGVTLDHLRSRREALAAARRELAKARRMRWLRRGLTVGLWRR